MLVVAVEDVGGVTTLDTQVLPAAQVLCHKQIYLMVLMFQMLLQIKVGVVLVSRLLQKLR